MHVAEGAVAEGSHEIKQDGSKDRSEDGKAKEKKQEKEEEEEKKKKKKKGEERRRKKKKTKNR